ncbi:hypothetical protein [Ktedonobacter racemifer]|uniref:hypothetical protein n=1 Tax=Ktedonobacter racemifer TaxID=363277 RepID=UPI0002F501B3|nr:hypothetical protein [Ktedonobacter racemifer]
MRERGRGFNAFEQHQQHTQARQNWLYGQWLAREAERRPSRLPVRPWETLLSRALVSIEP